MADRKVRIWAAVEENGRPVCKIIDYDTTEDAPKDSASFRLFRWAVWEHGEPPHTTGHSKGGCFAAAPCAKCHKAAAGYWVEWQNRTDERKFVPATAAGKKKEDDMAAGGGLNWSASDWGEAQKTLPKAFEAARAGGYPWVVERDGHGHIFQWREVSP